MTVQEKWFSRLYLLKALVISSLALLWIVSGLIALLASFDAAARILTSHGVPNGLARGATLVTSCFDIAVGILIAIRRTSRLAFGPGSLCRLAICWALPYSPRTYGPTHWGHW